ncbi:MAG: hypothetical protein WCC11_03670 [Gammaproteobacteria bacterium]
MNAPQLIRQCEHLGIRLSINGDLLHVVGADRLTPGLKAELIQHKPAILAVLATENASEYLAERGAICAVDRLPPAHVRPVFSYHLEDYLAPLIVLGTVGETLSEITASLRDRYGGRLLSAAPYQWPPQPPRKTLN